MAGRKCSALYDYVARDNEELSIKKGEKLTVVSDQGTWWTVGNDRGLEGLVPSNYVEIDPQSASVPPPGGASIRTNIKEEPNMYHQPDLMIQRNGPSLNIRAIAKFKYIGSREDELSLEKGDDVIVMEKEADGWWRGRCGTQIGWFPFNYVEEQEGKETTTAAAPAKKFVCGVIALYSFNSGNPEELPFEKGDLMDIVDQPPDDPDWWEARKADGSTGLVPRNYVEIVHDAEPVFGASGGSPGSRSAGIVGGHAYASGTHSPPPFAHEPWYHGRLARKQAESILNSLAQNCQFIVRSSETKVCCAYICECLCKHTQLW